MSSKQKIENYSFEFLKLSGFRDIDPKVKHFFVWPREQRAKLLKLKVLTPYLERLQELLKEKPHRKFGPAPTTFNAHLPFTEGGGLSFLLVDAKASTLELFEGLRDGMPSDPQVLVSALERAPLKTLVVEGAASLLELRKWKPPVYGQRAEKTDEDKKDKGKVEGLEIYSGLSPRDAAVAVERGLLSAQGTNLVRTLAETPGNYLNPTLYRKRIQEIAKEKKLGFEFLDEKKLKAMGAGSFLAVARAEESSGAGIAHLTYKGGARPKKKLTLVGKGLCFDTGGYNIKTGSYMAGMHKDMTGSAIVLATISLIAELKLPVEVHAYLALAENLISPTAFRPNDVVTALDGTSIEVLDTDAEGRMVLADTLALARRQKPDLCIDFATLTGSCLRATDKKRSGVFSPDFKLALKAKEISERAGERLWPFETGGSFWDGLSSTVADIKQLSPSPNADMSYAATFLSHFIGEETPWLHVDLSAHLHPGGLGLVKTEETGFGVRLALSLVEELLLAKAQ